jgi:hypothetical protein
MDTPDKKADALKRKVRHELIEYAINFVYLTLVLVAFTQYRRFLLASYDIAYTNYWVPMIEAAILGKVIMIGNVFRLGRGLEEWPLIFPTLYKTIVFTIFIAVFKFVEHAIVALWNHGGLTADLVEFSEKGALELLANSLMIIAGFIPFFAVKELARVMGGEKIAALFFRRRAIHRHEGT